MPRLFRGKPVDNGISRTEGNMTLARTLCLATAIALSSASVLAQDDPLPEGFTAEPLIKTVLTRDGEPIVYPTGTPEIVSVIGTLEPGGRTPLHEHPVPVYVYVLEGEIELKTEGGEPQRYSAGQAFIEAQNRKHQAFNVAETSTRVLVVFVGAEGQPPTVAFTN